MAQVEDITNKLKNLVVNEETKDYEIIEEKNFEWKIEDWNSVDDGAFSDSFKIGYQIWNIILYPNGNHEKGIRGYTSIYLLNNDSLHENKNICANIVMYIRNYNDSTIYEAKELSTFDNHDNNSDIYGFDKFINKSELNNYSKSLVENNKTIIGAYIRVVNLNKRVEIPFYPGKGKGACEDSDIYIVKKTYNAADDNDDDITIYANEKVKIIDMYYDDTWAYGYALNRPYKKGKILKAFIKKGHDRQNSTMSMQSTYSYYQDSTPTIPMPQPNKRNNLLSHQLLRTSMNQSFYDSNTSLSSLNEYNYGNQSFYDQNTSSSSSNPINNYNNNNNKVLSPAEIKELEEEYWSYVQLTCIEGKIEELEKLFNDKNNKFDIVNAKTVDGWTTLHIAVFNNQYEIAKSLINHGSNVNAEKDEYTPLYIACQDGHFDIVRLLVERGANFKKLSKGFTPVHVACQYGYIKVVEYLLNKGANPVIKNDVEGEYHLLHTAVNAEENSLEMIKFLLIKNFNPNVKDSRGMTPLHIAVLNNKVDVAKYLIDVGKADLDCEESKVNTPLHFACRNANSEMVKLILKYNIAIDCPNSVGMTPLHMACENDDLDIVILLVNKGANINATTFEGWTPLHFAVLYGNYDIVKYLLDKKPSHIDGKKLINMAKTSKNDSIALLIINYINYNEDNNNYINQRGFNDNVNQRGFIDDVNQRGFNNNVNQRGFIDDVNPIGGIIEDENESQILINAVKENRIAEASNIIVLNCEYLNFRDKIGWTALHWASYLNHIQLVKLLIDNGALTSLKTIDGINNDNTYKNVTARDIAKLRKNKEIAKIIRNHIYIKRAKVIFGVSKIAVSATAKVALG